VLFITPFLYPQIVGGIEVFNYFLIQELGKDYTVTYLNVDTGNNIKELKNAKRIKIKDTSQFSRLLQIVKYTIINRNNYDLILTSFSRTAWYYIIIYPILNLLFSKQYLIIIHGGGLMPWKWEFPFQLYFKKAKSIVGVSKMICEEYHKRTGLEILYIPPLIPFEKAIESKKELRNKHRLDLIKKIFLYVGSLKELKRPNVIVEAMSFLGRDYLKKHNILMIFAGEGDLKNELLKTCRKNDLEDYFLFLGNVQRDQIHEFYKLSNYYIISSDYEGTPISMLEAMYNNLPIIASNVRGINSVVDSSKAILFNNKDFNSLANGIKKILSNDELAHLISNNSLNYYNKKFDYNLLIDNYKRII
jgi:glycosyltransferase involved in cell wall biosynthesis